MTETALPHVAVRPATAEDRPTVDRLWLMFRHDLSAFRPVLPARDGTFRDVRVESAFSRPGWAPYLFECGTHPAGFAFVRGLDGPVRVLNSFFVVRGARRRGVGLRAVRAVLTRHPGPWEIAFQQDNPSAVAFWHRVAADGRLDPRTPAGAGAPRTAPGRVAVLPSRGGRTAARACPSLTCK